MSLQRTGGGETRQGSTDGEQRIIRSFGTPNVRQKRRTCITVSCPSRERTFCSRVVPMVGSNNGVATLDYRSSPPRSGYYPVLDRVRAVYLIFQLDASNGSYTACSYRRIIVIILDQVQYPLQSDDIGEFTRFRDVLPRWLSASGSNHFFTFRGRLNAHERRT